MKEFIDKLMERLEEYEQERLKMYDWQGQSATSDVIVIIKDIADEYRTCYKSCMECEAYNKEKHYCPKWCDVIKNTISELAEEYKLFGNSEQVKVSEMQTGWIPCSERLPEADHYVLCQGNNSMFVACVDSFDGEWRDNHCYKRTAVRAWRELPAPYTEGE